MIEFFLLFIQKCFEQIFKRKEIIKSCLKFIIFCQIKISNVNFHIILRLLKE